LTSLITEDATTAAAAATTTTTTTTTTAAPAAVATTAAGRRASLTAVNCAKLVSCYIVFKLFNYMYNLDPLLIFDLKASN